MAGSLEASNNAKKWAIVSALVFVALLVLWILLAVVAGSSSG
jgi:hypothetical protein